MRVCLSLLLTSAFLGGWGSPMPAHASHLGSDKETRAQARVVAEDRRARMSGRVLREDGTPITSFFLNGEWVRAADGSFELKEERSGSYRLVFVAQGLASTVRTLEARVGESVSAGEVVLKKGTMLRGRVLDAVTRAPVVGALIDVSEEGLDEQYEASLSAAWGAVRSRADGTFVLRLETEAPTLIVTHPRYPQRWVPLSSKDANLLLTLEPGATLKGRAARYPGKCTRVKLVREDGSVSREGLVDRGAYRLGAIPAGDYFLTAWDVCGYRTGHPLFGPEKVQMPARGVVTHDIK